MDRVAFVVEGNVEISTRQTTRLGCVPVAILFNTQQQHPPFSNNSRAKCEFFIKKQSKIIFDGI